MMLHYATATLPAGQAGPAGVPADLDLTLCGNPTGERQRYYVDGRADLVLSITHLNGRYDVEISHRWVGGRRPGGQRTIFHCTDITPGELGDCLRRAHLYATCPAEEL